MNVLFLFSSPNDRSRLALGREHREVVTKMGQAAHRESWQLTTCWSVRPEDLLQALLETNPHVVHFSGHCQSDNEVLFVDAQGRASPVPLVAFDKLFGALKGTIRLVVLNACHSEALAQAIAKHIDFVIGMNGTMSDHAAIIFSSTFYMTLAHHRSIQTAFELAKSALLLHGCPEYAIPKLLYREGLDPDDVYSGDIVDGLIEPFGSSELLHQE